MKNPYNDIHELVKDIGLRDILFQRKILGDDGKKVSARLGRQMGSTTIITVRAIWDAINENGIYVFIIVPTEIQCSLVNNNIFEYILKSTLLKDVVSNVSKQIMKQDIRSNMFSHDKLQISFNNGSMINIVVGGSEHLLKGYQIGSLIVDEIDYISDEHILPYIEAQRIPPKTLFCGTPAGRYPPGLFETSFWSTVQDMGTYYEYSTHWYGYNDGIKAGLFNPEFALSMLKRGTTIEAFLKDFEAMFPQEIQRALRNLNKRGILKYFNRTYMRPRQRLMRWIQEKMKR